MTAPDVVVRSQDGSYYDATLRAWSGRDVQPLVPEGRERPLHHSETCCFRRNPALVEVCPCTRRQRDYRASHPH
jgi:hypothetical protein